jgi:hypothetical protein
MKCQGAETYNASLAKGRAGFSVEIAEAGLGARIPKPIPKPKPVAVTGVPDRRGDIIPPDLVVHVVWEPERIACNFKREGKAPGGVASVCNNQRGRSFVQRSREMLSYKWEAKSAGEGLSIPDHLYCTKLVGGICTQP